tara:strand:+ start:1334 stop:1996 length:663 start_codon:yes stop_codon:yes gene_type:complete
MIEKNLLKRIFTSLILITVLLSMFLSSFVMISILIIISSITFYEFNSLFLKIFKSNFLRFFFSAITLLYLFLILLILFFAESNQNINQDLKLYFFYSIVVSINSDIGGFVVGKVFKGKKLTKISPNKTISGSIGAFIFSLLTIPIFLNNMEIVNLKILILITLVISFISQLGDLFISYLKRLAKVKDTGKILPGHGGILDRIDGILFASPFGLLLLNLIN